MAKKKKSINNYAKMFRNPLFIVCIVLGGYVIFNLFSPSEPASVIVSDRAIVATQNVSLNDFLARYKSGSYDKVELVDETHLRGLTETGGVAGDILSTMLGSVATRYTLQTTQKPLGTSIADLGIDPESKTVQFVASFPQDSFWASFLLNRGPTLLLLGLLVFMMRGMGKGAGALPFNLKIGTVNNKKNNQTKFCDVAGMDEVKGELMEVVDFLKNPKKYHEVGARTPKGVLLYGQPGTGKTLLARAVAGESDVPFLYSSGAEFMGMFVGVGSEKVRTLFENAKKLGKAIIFIDEIDAFGKRRGSGVGGHHQGQEEIVNQILTEMDGFAPNTSVVVIAATNRVDVLDPALTRAGRFDRKIMVGRPTYDERLAILNYYLQSKKVAKSVDIQGIARRISGFVGADIENVVNEASLKLAKDGRKVIQPEDFEYALEKHLMGPEKKIKSLSEKERQIVTYHELGHAVTSYVLDEADQVEKITIVSRGQALGLTWKSSDEDRYLYSKTKILHEVVSLLGGRAAEEIRFGKDHITTGASNDFERATRMVSDMVAKYGMDEDLGPVMYWDQDKDNYTAFKPYSEKTGELIDAKIKSYLMECYTESKDILQKHKSDIDRMAEVLLAKEYLSKEEFELLMEDVSQADAMLVDYQKKVEKIDKEEKEVAKKKTTKKADDKSPMEGMKLAKE